MTLTDVPPAADAPPGARADAAVARVLADLDTTTERGIVVDSPPGAGKSTLVIRATGHLAERGRPVMIAAQTNEQVDDLVDRLAGTHPGLAIGRLHATGHVLPPRVTRHPRVTGAAKIDPLRDLPVVVGTAAKWAHVDTTPWDWAIVDEAYQMRSDALLRTARLFERALFVGDPGQLDPFATVETDRWTGLSWNPMSNAVDVVLAHNPTMHSRRLPVSWRLPETAAPLVRDAFYPFQPFVSGTVAADRVLTLDPAPQPADDPRDTVLDRAAAGGWGYLELPERHTLRTDGQLADALATTTDHLLRRAPLANGEPIGADRVAIGTAHNDQAAAVRDRLAALGPHLADVTVDTANKLQGREFDVTLIWHPLSGRTDASAFHLETGRLCVLLSRHRHACVVVARAGIRELLDRHPTTRPVHLDVPPKFPDGWRAHQLVLDHLDRPAHRVPTG
ncbi:AAA family ATPase [Streptomyces sp. ST2-7A]|uniref:AAA family ATPase n=1 Tax=Streptomyces sp. ST2-7A TaxID=2907214 RepID=UPI001F3B72A0|nr:AAA family ATPase [Streptomyces sp. ST2-7A]MCE7081955.1 AAA family ATPase [Streptomyces sp. ST2-7A]